MDILMPDMDGIAAAPSAANTHVQVIGMTGMEHESLKQRAASRGREVLVQRAHWTTTGAGDPRAAGQA